MRKYRDERPLAPLVHEIIRNTVTFGVPGRIMATVGLAWALERTLQERGDRGG
ncbi:hypothetical protein HMPREF0293_2649 [Corynebacterium glucuronolyticum ATCC 51866]|uniref:Uncharacterized protein n=1 Tax=Corynebacterium glucuronolyticum ATCC 51866 TaxID=548478 RepID=A0ABM9XL74_9CORY|nr:hypothetical protein HMPREF0293_2649 [Corynebacterium glucuronolyticum ATCC 51866]